MINLTGNILTTIWRACIYTGLSIVFFVNSAVGNVIKKTDIASLSLPKPRIEYSNNSLDSTFIFRIEGKARLLSGSDRVGIHATSAHTRLLYSNHLFNSQKGSFSVWLMPLDDLTASVNYPGMKRDNEFYNIFPVVTDHANICDVWSANFSFYINKVWHPGMTAKFVKGNGNDRYNHASVAANHSEFEKYRWYQLTLSWDFQKNEIALYINGVKVGSHDTTAKKLIREVCGDTLYAGNPSLCISEMKFYDQALDDNLVYSIYRNEVTDFDEEFDQELKYTYAGVGRKPFDWQLGNQWEEKLNVSFLKPNDLDRFYVQGYMAGPKLTEEGLLVETPNVPISIEVVEQQLYLWTKQAFEGDLYLEYEF